MRPAQLFEIQHAAMETIGLADEIQKAAADALEANRTQSARIVTSRNAVFQAVRAILLAPITTRDAAASRRSAARNIHDIVSQLSMDEQTLSGAEAALLRGKYETSSSQTHWCSEAPASMSRTALRAPSSQEYTSRVSHGIRRDAGTMDGYIVLQGAHKDAARTGVAAAVAGQVGSTMDYPLHSAQKPTRAGLPSLDGSSSCTIGSNPVCTASSDRSTAGSIPGSPLEAWMEAERRKGVAHHHEHDVDTSLLSDNGDVELSADTFPFDLQDEDINA